LFQKRIFSGKTNPFDALGFSNNLKEYFMGWPWDGLKRKAVKLFRRVDHAVRHSPIGSSIMTSPVGTIIRQTVPYRV
jgi:hypothetical protein